MQRPLNVYYRDYSANLSNEQRDKLMNIMLHEGDDKPQDDLADAFDMNTLHAQEGELGALVKGQTELSRQMREDLRGGTRKSDKQNGQPAA